MIGFRKRWNRLLRRLEGRAYVLMYHRIAEVDVDPWQLAVHPRRFEAHLDALRATTTVVPMRELAERVRAGRSVRGLAAITFDDGYADNARVARPMLERRGLPATFFVSTGVIDGASRFWWDVVEDVLLRRSRLPHRLDLGPGSAVEAFDLGETAILDEPTRAAIRGWNAERPHVSARTRAFHHVWSTLHGLSPDRRAVELERLEAWAGPTTEPGPGPLGGPATMRADELRGLGASELFEVGAHGVTHVALANVDAPTREREVRGSVETLAAWLGRPVVGFAYPNGSHDEATRRAVRDVGVRYAVTTSGASVTRKADPYMLGRVHVADIEADALLRRLGRRSSRSRSEKDGRAA